MQIIKSTPPPLPSSVWIGLDIEIANLNMKQIHRPTSGQFACMSIAIGDVVYLIRDVNDIPKALENIKDCMWVIQHAKFDLTHLRRWATIKPRKKVWDTMLMERILWGGYYDLFGLEHLARRYCDIYLDKTLQKSFISTELSPAQEEYSAMDAWILLKIVEEQKKATKPSDWKIWQEIDLPAMWAFMDFQGFAIDVSAWQKLAKLNKKRQEEIDAQLPFNPRSWQQVTQNLQKLGFKNLPNSREETLQSAIEKYSDAGTARGIAQKILDSRMYSKRASTYGFNFISDFLEYELNDEVVSVPFIYADYSVVGAETGRTSCSNPNMQNIPIRDTNEFRKCFIARPKHKLVIGDYSQQEVFIVAYLSQDERLIEVCNSKEDVYIIMADIMYNKRIDKSDPLRRRMKDVVLGANYGLSSIGLAKKEKISEDEAEEVLTKFGNTFPGVKSWMSQQQHKTGYVQTVAGRKCWLNPYNNQSPRNALNDPNQGSAGDCTKKALANIHQGWFINQSFGGVGFAHDELIFDVPEEKAEVVATFVQEVMIGTANKMFPGLKFRADVIVANNWGEK